MATVTLNIVFQQTMPTLNGAAIDAILAWIQTNVTSKLPASATATVTFTNIQP